MKIIVAHEGKQHSYRTAEALQRSGSLAKYITTIYDKPRSLTRLVKHLLRGSMRKKASSRVSERVDPRKVQLFCEPQELLLLLISKISMLKRFGEGYRQRIQHRFGIKVAKYAIRHGVDGVIMYDTGANSCFEYLLREAPHIKRILDVTIANRLYLLEIYIADSQLDNSNIVIEQELIFTPQYIERCREELQLSQYFLAGSNFVRDSLLYSGVEAEQIRVVPYGVDVAKFSCKEYDRTPSAESTPLKVLFIGCCSYRKGLHHLLKVVESYPTKSIELYIAGDYSADSPIYVEYHNRANIHFLGFTSRDTLHSYISRCDIFALPSLAEGLALVTLEAMASGLPIICTTNTGVNDLIRDYQHGFVISPSKSDELRSRIDWYMENRSSIEPMGRRARELVKCYTWDNYSAKLMDAVREIINH
ncbi:MAG: glycosyltransferase family 4 protein [Rikenellaceae bacterium]